VVGLVKLSDKFTTAHRSCRRSATRTPPNWCAPKTGRIIGALTGILIVMKGLPLAYAKDMQEDKEGAMDALSALSLAVAAMTGMVTDLIPDTVRMKKAAGEGYATATDLADWLVRSLNIPFGRPTTSPAASSALAAEQSVPLHRVELAAMQAIGAANHG